MARTGSLATRLWRYQVERFPLYLISPMALVVLASSSAVATHASTSNVILAGVTVFLFMAHMRLFDEFKDLEHDRRHHPDRPLPRGVVTRIELGVLLLGILAAECVLNLWLNDDAGRRWFLIAFSYSALSGKEFFLSRALRPRLLLYNAVHFLQLAWLQLYVFATLGGLPLRPGAWLFNMSILAMLLLEVVRKVRTEEDDRAGDTYSAVLGPAGAGAAVAVIAFATTAAAAGTVLAERGTWWVLVGPAAALAGVLASTTTYINHRATADADRLQLAGVALFLVSHLSVVVAAWG